MAQDASRRFNRAGLPLIATVARLLCREVTLENEYLRVENSVGKPKAPGRIRFTDEERRSPNVNAHCERWGRSLREECLNHLIVFGIKSLRRVVRTFQRFHSDHRPHQGTGNRVPRAVRTGEPMPEALNGPIGKVHCDEFLGGPLKSYPRAAA